MALRERNSGDIPISQQHSFLDAAKEYSWSEMKRLVLEAPALVCVQPCGRWSALHQAAYGGNLDAVRFLLAHNAPIDATTSTGKTPLEVATRSDVKAAIQNSLKGSDPGMAQHDHCVCTPKAPCSKGVVKTTQTSKLSKAMKVKKKGKIAKGKRAKVLVYKGHFQKTTGGLTISSLAKSKAGKIVSSRMQARGHKAYTNIKPWVEAFKQARMQLGLKGFVAVKKGSPLYEKTLEFYQA
jgi:ankyrin repeat protein